MHYAHAIIERLIKYRRGVMTKQGKYSIEILDLIEVGA